MGRKVIPQGTDPVLVEVQRHGTIDRIAGGMAGVFRNGRIILPVLAQTAGEQTQAADPERQVVRAQERHRGRCHQPFGRGQAAHALAPQVIHQGPGCDLLGQCRHRLNHVRGQGLDDPGELQLDIAVPGEPCLPPRRLVRLVAPGGQAAHGRVIQEQGVAEQALDRLLDLGTQGLDDAAQPRHLARLDRQDIQVVADRLFARNRGQRTENHREPAGRARIVPTQAAHPIRVGIDVDEPAIDLALGRAIAQHAHGFGEGRVDQHGPVDQGQPGKVGLGIASGQQAPQERLTSGPRAPAFLRQAIKLGHLQRGKGPGETGGGPRRKDQFERIGQGAAGRGRGRRTKPDRDAMLRLLDPGGGVQRDRLGMALEVGGGDEQVQRVAGGQQGSRPGRAGHGVKRVGDQAGKSDSAERRVEPAGTDQAGQLGPHFGPGFGRDAFRHDIARALQREPDQRSSPELGKAPARFGRRIEQHVDIGLVQPQARQRLERLSRMDRLGQEHAVDPARAGPGDDVGQDPQAQPVPGFEMLEQGAVDALAVFGLRLTGVVGTAGAGELPQLLGHPVHVDRQADSAVADQRDPQFLLPHGNDMDRNVAERNCVPITFCLQPGHGQTQTPLRLLRLRQCRHALAGPVRRLRRMEHPDRGRAADGVLDQA